MADAAFRVMLRYARLIFAAIAASSPPAAVIFAAPLFALIDD